MTDTNGGSMQMWFTQKRHQFALWLVRMLTEQDATVIPASSLKAAEARFTKLEEYVSIHSGRLNDGTTRTVRHKLRNSLQECRYLLTETHRLERVALQREG